ncbi:MAG TPA: AMP nucleosidase [Alphaproteobacteria bacterium]|nr:AMP nucleosidase [Alphaproteobacteria bacterium]
MSKTADVLIDRIDRFLAQSGMSPTVFGRKALNDPNFVFDLRAGKRSPSIRTVEKIDSFIESHGKKSKAPTSGHEERSFTDADEAVAYLKELYERSTGYLREHFQRLAKGEKVPGHVSAYYPYVAIMPTTTAKVDTRLAYGFVGGPGRYSITVTRPDLFENYYREQFRLLMQNHDRPVEVGLSTTPIPIHFAFTDGMHVEGGLDPSRVEMMRTTFDLPDLAVMDDAIANGTSAALPNGDRPLGLFTAPRVDYSLHRLQHYTGCDPRHFQNFVIFTNYQFYVDEFMRMANEYMTKTDKREDAEYRKQYTSLVEPGGFVTSNANLGPAKTTGTRATRMPQMPAYHLTRADKNGITIVNIGVGPSNARTISDHIAVIRPHAWIMLGHCAGLRESQKLGDYVLAHAYVRDDHVLDSDLPIWVPIPALAEVQRALQDAVAHVTGLKGYDLKSVMRTGTVATTDNRNWEIGGYSTLMEGFNKSRAMALDMESATIAANGFRFRVPYGTLLCVSDRPLHGEIKLPGMANRFYRQQIDQHLLIGLKTMELLREIGRENLHSRKLRSFSDTAFQ